MGTSASGNGPGGTNPLIPDWIDTDGLPNLPPDQKEEQQDNDETDNEQTNSDVQVDDATTNEHPIKSPNESQEIPNRFTSARRNFNKYIQSGGRNQDALKDALKQYSKYAAGGTKRLARRMAPSASRVALFYNVINTIKDKGKPEALIQFNLADYQEKPLLDILSSLADEIFKDTGKLYEDTQDDSIVKQAYANTVVRICGLEEIDLDNLSNQQVEVMLAIFIEETIAQRVINDIGGKFTKIIPDISELVELEDSIYQIISGLVRTQIISEITATQLGDKKNIETKIENIYRQAFDAMAGLID